VSGFSTSLPNILAGVAGAPLLYAMVKRCMGELAGLLAALVMTLTPVFLATNRNNTMDGLLVFTLLVAALAFIQAAEAGSLDWLLLGAFIIGLGFNIKMLQAFLPLPAFYTLYFFAARQGWLKKLLHLLLASLLLLAVSLSWALAVDLTPASERPYIGSSSSNSVMGLILGHNALARLGLARAAQGQPAAPQNAPPAGQRLRPYPNPQPPEQARQACQGLSEGQSCSFTLPGGGKMDGVCSPAPNASGLVCAPQGMPPRNAPPYGAPGGSTPFAQETGSPGALRFFTAPLSKQMSWLLPFALLSLLLAAIGERPRLPLEAGAHKALLLWGGWLLTCLVFFSLVSGIFHAYYAIMLAPPLGAVVGMGFARLWHWGRQSRWAGVILVAAAALTLAFQFFAAGQYGELSWWMAGAALLLVAAIALLPLKPHLAFLLALLSMLVIPGYWSAMTVLAIPDLNLPTAYGGQASGRGQPGARPFLDGNRDPVDGALLDYLQANTQGVKYLAAVPSSQQGAGLVLATGRPVLYMGGFSGGDAVVDAQKLAGMVERGELRYVLMAGERGGQQGEIAGWVEANCERVTQFDRLFSCK
jgi:4-amino-4-deoxy-L-arabinose transferase-like glycosyltransferase